MGHILREGQKVLGTQSKRNEVNAELGVPGGQSDAGWTEPGTGSGGLLGRGGEVGAGADGGTSGSEFP